VRPPKTLLITKQKSAVIIDRQKSVVTVWARFDPHRPIRQFVEKYAADPVIASAILTAPTFLSGLSDAELTMVWHKVETHVDPAILEARDEAAKALEEAEAGWQRAQDLVAERGGLVKGADGFCHEPPGKAAAA